MVVLFANFFTVLSFFVTLTVSLSVRTKREVIRPRVTISQGSFGAEQSKTGECLQIKNNNIPIPITLLQSSHPNLSYQLLGYSSSTDCQFNRAQRIHVPLPPNQPKVVNPRKKICSFKLKEHSGSSQVTVKFTYGSTSVGPHEFSLSNSNCVNLCTDSSSSNFAYPQNVEIQPATKLLKLFSKLDCNSPLANYGRNGRSLVDDTRQGGANQVVRYVMIKEVESEEDADY